MTLLTNKTKGNKEREEEELKMNLQLIISQNAKANLYLKKKKEKWLHNRKGNSFTRWRHQHDPLQI